MTIQPHLLLIDGSSYLFRAYYALPALENDQGEPTGAMYGVLNMIRKTLDDKQFSHVAVVFDTKGKNFRHTLYPNYKANRATMPEDLAQQIQPLHEIIEAMGIPLIKQEGIEADDIIGTLCLKAQKSAFQCTISTGDKDFAQLVSPGVTLLNTMTQSSMDETGVEKKFGVKPSQIIDYLALVGDSVDNIPGIPKVGPKTATKWLLEYHDIDTLIARAENIKGKIGENLRNNLDQLMLSKQLVTIDCHIDIQHTIDSLQVKNADTKVLQKNFKRYGFKKWLLELKHASNIPPVKKDTQYQLIENITSCKNLFKKIHQQKQFCLDTETQGLDPLSDELVGIAIALAPHDAYYIPLAHQAQAAIDKKEVLSLLQEALLQKEMTVIGHHLKFDMRVLMHSGISWRATCHDTMLQDYLLDHSNHSRKLDDLVQQHLGYTMKSYQTLMDKHEGAVNFSDIHPEHACFYACEDADMTWQLYEHFRQQLRDQAPQQKHLDAIEWPLIPVLAAMENDGVYLDSSSLKKQSLALHEAVTHIEKNIHHQAGSEFNIQSTKQLRHVLFEQLGLPVVKKTPAGQPSTNEDVLQTLQSEHAIAALILRHRSLSKLISTYTDSLSEKIHPNTQRIHTSYHQTGTSTGRLSSSNPNLQNIPIRSPEGRKIRHAFCAKPGYTILAADYSQIELRIMAHLCEEEALIQAFNHNEDIHRATAGDIFHCKPENVTDEQRRQAKAINFGLIYGMSAFGLAKQLHVSRPQAQTFIDTYFSRYPKVKTMMETIRQHAQEHGYVETLTGRRMSVPNINSNNQRLKAAAERAAINAPMQGSCADIIKMAMIDIQNTLMKQGSLCKMIMQVHDELVFELPTDHVKEASEMIKTKMEQVMALNIPLLVNIGTADNWDDAH